MRPVLLALALALAACGLRPARDLPPAEHRPGGRPVASGGAPSPAPPVPPAATALEPAPQPAPGPPRRTARESWSACRQPDSDEVAVVDPARRRLHQFVCTTALWVDGWFGGRGGSAWAHHVSGEAEVVVAHSEFEGWQDPRTRLRANAQLPTLERRLSAFVGRGDDEGFVQGRGEDTRRSPFDVLRKTDEWFAGLGYTLPDDWLVRTDVRAGVRGLSDPVAFVQVVVAAVPYDDDNDELRVRVIPFWNTHEHLGVTLRVDLDHLLGEHFLLRWANSGTEADGIPGLDWREALTLYHDLRKQRVLAYELFARGTTGLPEPLTEYGGRVIYRHPLLPERLIGELGLGYSWPRVDPALPREGSFGVSFGLTLPFGTD